MAAPVIIDLGDVGAGEAGRSYPPWRWRALVVGAIALLFLPALAGSRPTEIGLSRPLWTISPPWPDFVVGARVVYAVHSNTVTALDLRTGRKVWTLPMDYPTVILDAGEFAAMGPAGEADTLLVDGSGTVVATLPGFPVGATRSGRHVLLLESVLGLDCPVAPGNCTRLSAWDLAHRTRTWSAVVFNFALEEDEADRIDGVAIVAGDGTVEIRDPDTGRVRGRISSLALGHPNAYGTSVIHLFRDTVATVVAERREALISLYRPPAARPAWALRLPVSDLAPADVPFNLAACGEMLCFEVVGVGTTAIDPASGRVRWTTPNRVVARLGPRVLATSWIFNSGDNCLGCWDVTLGDPDAGSVATFSGSLVVPWVDAAGNALIAVGGPAGTGFTVLRADGTAQPLGAVPGVQVRCSARRDVLVCYSRSVLRAWRLPLPDRS